MDSDRRTATSSAYAEIHTKNIHKGCPGSIYERSKYISIMILEKDNTTSNNFFLRDIVYMPIEDAYKKYIENQLSNYPEPYDKLSIVYPKILKERILSQTRFSLVEEVEEVEVKECFDKFKEGKEDEKDRIFLDNKMHFDDNLIDWKLTSELNLRYEAENIIKRSENGSWLIRRSSVKEQDYIKIRVITFNNNGVIRNFLFAHINGFGYVLTDGARGQIMPKLGEDKTLKIQLAFYSLPEVLIYLKNEGISLEQIIV